MAIVKLLHVLFLFLWVGSLLTLTRLVGYLAKEPPLVLERMLKLSRRLYLLVDLPSMIIGIGLGIILLIFNGVNLRAPWLHMKLTAAFLLVVSDVLFGCALMRHCRTQTIGKGVIYRVAHGSAGIIFIVVLVAVYILKPRYS
jgi:uncharacterized membrane protein